MLQHSEWFRVLLPTIPSLFWSLPTKFRVVQYDLNSTVEKKEGMEITAKVYHEQ